MLSDFSSFFACELGTTDIIIYWVEFRPIVKIVYFIGLANKIRMAFRQQLN